MSGVLMEKTKNTGAKMKKAVEKHLILFGGKW
jgi:hypothetical protein